MPSSSSFKLKCLRRPSTPPHACPATNHSMYASILLPCPMPAPLPSLPRSSGGHSYMGYSVMPGQLTISLDKMNVTTVAADGATAVVQAGARLGQVRAGEGGRALPTLQQVTEPPLHPPRPLACSCAVLLMSKQSSCVSIALPLFHAYCTQLYYAVDAQTKGTKAAVGGTCPPVGAGGLLTGGGIGFLTRQYGLGCDQFVSFKMVGGFGGGAQRGCVLLRPCGVACAASSCVSSPKMVRGGLFLPPGIREGPFLAPFHRRLTSPNVPGGGGRPPPPPPPPAPPPPNPAPPHHHPPTPHHTTPHHTTTTTTTFTTHPPTHPHCPSGYVHPATGQRTRADHHRRQNAKPRPVCRLLRRRRRQFWWVGRWGSFGGRVGTWVRRHHKL